MITIDQLLESVVLNFEPRWITKDSNGIISIFAERPERQSTVWDSCKKMQIFGKVKLTEFDGKIWTECIYEVPRKTTGRIEHIKTRKSIDCSDTPEAHIEKHRTFVEIWDKINELVDAVNELKEKNNG